MHFVNRERPWQWLLLALLFFGCEPESGWVVAENDFEQTDNSADPNPAWRSNEQAYSGQWSCKLTPELDFGPGLTNTWAELGSPQEIRISAQVFSPARQLRAAIMVVVTSAADGTSVFNRMIYLNEVVKRYNQWEQVHQRLLLPQTLSSNDVVKIYLWHWQEKHPFYVDHLVVEKLK